MLKLTTDKHEASRGLFATAELLVCCVLLQFYHYLQIVAFSDLIKDHVDDDYIRCTVIVGVHLCVTCVYVIQLKQ